MARACFAYVKKIKERYKSSSIILKYYKTTSTIKFFSTEDQTHKPMVGLATILATGKNTLNHGFWKMERILLKMML